jgi:hypothetical protein
VQKIDTMHTVETTKNFLHNGEEAYMIYDSKKGE